LGGIRRRIMKKCTIGLILLFISVIIASSPAFSQDKRKTNRYSGTVQEVDVKAKTLVVNKENQNLGMLFEAKNPTFKNVKGLEDLKRGDRVVIEYDAKQGKTIAVTVTKGQ
jgi:Cu/Ag efflux protein CusF